MNSLFILSYNNLQINFWEQHLDLDAVDNIYLFNKGATCLNNLTKLPEAIIIDEYFAPIESGSITADDIIQAVLLASPNTHVYHLSPAFCNNAVRDVIHPHYKSNFNQTILQVLNQQIMNAKVHAA